MTSLLASFVPYMFASAAGFEQIDGWGLLQFSLLLESGDLLRCLGLRFHHWKMSNLWWGSTPSALMKTLVL